jgi:glycosyltransferase involved in cell wall biosynthesis
MSRRVRFAVVVSHPIPYWVPYYRVLVKHGGLNLRVFFATRIGLDKTLDPGMGIELAWKTDLLGGYEHVFLPEAESIRGTTFRELDNPSIGRALAEFAPDVLLIHGYTQRTMLRALAWCRKKGIPALMVSDSSLHSGTNRVMRGLKRALLPTVLRQFSAFLSVGDTNQTYLESFGVPRARIFRVPPMVDEGFWAHRDERHEERARMRSLLRLSDNDLVVLFVGKLIARKRPGDLITALARLRSMPPAGRQVTVIFAGDGALRAALEREAAAMELPARFLGFVNIDALPGYFGVADVLAHPAELETFGVIALEAAILGLPLLLSDRVGAIGPTSIARPGENALTYPCGDVTALSIALHRLANEPETLARLAAASRRISEEFDGRMAVSGTLAAVNHSLRGAKGVHLAGPPVL